MAPINTSKCPSAKTITLDNAGPGFRVLPSEAWAVATATNAYNNGSLLTTAAAANARWTPLLPRAGAYQVYAWWGGTNATLDSNATYVVRHAGGLTTNVVNQNTNAGRWTQLGTFDFAADRQEYVDLRPSGLGGAITLADAVQFVNQEAFNLSRALTLEAWVKADVLNRPWQAMITKGHAWGLLCYSNSLVFRTHDDSGRYDLITAAPVQTNRWYHVAATYDGSRKILYVDGAVAASAMDRPRCRRTRIPCGWAATRKAPAASITEASWKMSASGPPRARWPISRRARPITCAAAKRAWWGTGALTTPV